MNGEPLPEGAGPSASKVAGYLKTSDANVRRTYAQLYASLAAARLYIEQLIGGETTDEELLAALRDFHQKCRALLAPTTAMVEDLVAGQFFAESLSWEVLGVPLVDTEMAPSDIADQVEAWLGQYQPGVH